MHSSDRVEAISLDTRCLIRALRLLALAPRAHSARMQPTLSLLGLRVSDRTRSAWYHANHGPLGPTHASSWTQGTHPLDPSPRMPLLEHRVSDRTLGLLLGRMVSDRTHIGLLGCTWLGHASAGQQSHSWSDATYPVGHDTSQAVKTLH